MQESPEQPIPPSAAPEPVHPRSPRKRFLAQQTVTPGIRSQPLPRSTVVEPPLPIVEPQAPTGPWRWRSAFLILAILGWAGALALFISNQANLHVLLPLAWGLAALLTFGPLQWRFALSGITWQGVFGWSLLGYIAAFVPPPVGGLLDLPEVPVYLLLFLAVFYAAATLAFPIAFWIGQKVFTGRLYRLDVRRARRQGYETGLLAVALLGLAGLRVLGFLTGLLMVIVIVLLETLLLSQSRVEG